MANSAGAARVQEDAAAGAKQVAEGRDWQTRAFPIQQRGPGASVLHSPGLHPLPATQTTTNLASLKKLLNRKACSHICYALTPFLGVTGPAKRRGMQGERRLRKRRHRIQVPHHRSCVLHHICKANAALPPILQAHD